MSPSSKGISFDGDWVGCQAEIMEMVWGFLKANQDLIAWSLCRAGATDNFADCVLAYIRGERDDIELSLVGDPLLNENDACVTSSGGGFKMKTNPGGLFGKDRIFICQGINSQFDRTYDLFCRDFGGQHCADCSIIALASSFLHEVTHLCSGPQGEHGDDIPGTWWDDKHCSIPHLTGSFFARAAFERYWKAATCSCCSEFLTHQPGMSSLPALNDDCYTRAPDTSGPGPGGAPPTDGGPFIEFLPPAGPVVNTPFETYFLLDGAHVYI